MVLLWRLFFIVSLFVLPVTLWGEEQRAVHAKISGQIIDTEGLGIPYATVAHAGTAHGAVADAQGNFVLQSVFSAGEGVLIVSAMGFEKKRVPVNVQEGDLHLHAIQLSIDHQQIHQVVVTGQARPTPVDSSIYKVKLITLEKIAQCGALNLGEVLTTEANIRLATDLVLGTQIEMMGLQGQNVKVMFDGVPLIGRLDGNIDLSQVNLDNIQQVEIIEGPMSVIYGNNALAGTINLISKKNVYHKLESQAKGYAESIGRFSGNASVALRKDQHSLSLDGGYEYFSGVDFNKSDREMDWKPKNLYRANAAYFWRGDKWSYQLKAGLFNDKLLYKTNLENAYEARDTYYYTERYDVSASINGAWNARNNLNVVAAYSTYDRANQGYYKDMRTLEVTWSDKITTQQEVQKMVRLIHYYALVPNTLSWQSGIDVNVATMLGKRIDGANQSIGDYAAFLSVKYQPFSTLDIQPGLRYAYNTGYEAPLQYAVNTKWQLFPQFDWRLSFATGFRAPSIKELYYEFVDSNHEIYGNADLASENSMNFNTRIDYSFKRRDHGFSLSSSYYNSKQWNLISLVQQGTSTAYQYINISEYQTTGGDFSFNYNFKQKVKFNVGYGLTGRYNTYSTSYPGSKFYYSHDLFAGMSFKESRTGIRLAADYKCNGKLPNLYLEDDVVKEGFQETFHTLNASVSRKFWQNKCQMVAGIKNALNVTSVNQVGASGGGTHSENQEGNPIAYGRSYYISISYKFYK